MEHATLFVTGANPSSLINVRLMIESLRAFGGELANAPFWVFAVDPEPVRSLENGATRILPLAVSDPVAAYPFGKKVAACARAEELAPAGTGAIAWVDPACLIVQPPLDFTLGPDCDAAFRPVHIRNVGLPASGPLDMFWSGICTALGTDDIHSTVTSFVDGQLLRAYFNSHAFAVNPSLGLMRGWHEHFQLLVTNRSYQSVACSDERHRVFLFQALLSAMLATLVDPARLCLLPPTYNYPYNLHERVPAEKRPAALNDVVSFTYEERDIHPAAVTGIEVREPLRSWLESR